MAAIESGLAVCLPAHDPAVELVQRAIASMRRAPLETRVEDLAAEHHVAARTLQRLFRRYVGVSPKWVLKRLRIHQAAEQLAASAPPSWTELALDLGYYDHAHFIRDFRLVVGRSPARYAAEAAAGYAASSGTASPSSSSSSPSHSASRASSRAPASKMATSSVSPR